MGDYTNALLAARTLKCPACDSENIIVPSWSEAVDGSKRLVWVGCLNCDYEWPERKAA